MARVFLNPPKKGAVRSHLYPRKKSTARTPQNPRKKGAARARRNIDDTRKILVNAQLAQLVRSVPFEEYVRSHRVRNPFATLLLLEVWQQYRDNKIQDKWTNSSS